MDGAARVLVGYLEDLGLYGVGAWNVQRAVAAGIGDAFTVGAAFAAGDQNHAQLADLARRRAADAAGAYLVDQLDAGYEFTPAELGAAWSAQFEQFVDQWRRAFDTLAEADALPCSVQWRAMRRAG